jgi:hypothetical protein
LLMATSPPNVTFRRDLVGPQLISWNVVLQRLAWLWFFRQIKIAIVKNRPNVCIIHDRHADILKAVKTLKEAGPDEETPWLDLQSRWFMRHIGANFFHNS